MLDIILRKSNRNNKKWMVDVPTEKGRKKRVHFGAKGYEDYTIHKDASRKANYLSRHKGMNENWQKSGLTTPGFWARWLLWGEPTLSASIKNIEKKFNVNIIKK